MTYDIRSTGGITHIMIALEKLLIHKVFKLDRAPVPLYLCLSLRKPTKDENKRTHIPVVQLSGENGKVVKLPYQNKA